MQIDIDSLIKGLTLAFAIGSTFYTWSQAKNKAGAEALKDLDAKVGLVRGELAAMTTRVSKIEGELTHMPDKDTVHRLELSLKDMQARIDAQGETVKAVANTMRRVEEFLLNFETPRTPRARK